MIGNDVWIEAGVEILNGITVGIGSVIGMGAVVCKDVPPYAIVVEVPTESLDIELIVKLLSCSKVEMVE